jgi:dopamine beta-monooxygenase
MLSPVTLHVVLCALAAVMGGAQGYSRYAARIPNSNSVPHPSGIGTCPGAGHVSCRGGGHLNPFGKDFEAVGHKAWTKELCQIDSDGDG